MKLVQILVVFFLVSICRFSSFAQSFVGTDSIGEEFVLSEGIRKVCNYGLPVVVVEGNNNEEPTCEEIVNWEGMRSSINATKVRGRLYIVSPEGDLLYDSKPYIKDSIGMTIKVRGNTSSSEPKKSFKIKLEKKNDLLCRGDKKSFKDKNWVLIRLQSYGNYLRPLNYLVGLQVNKQMGLQWTPGCQYVNLVMNGTYRGLYALMESVKRNMTARLNVEDDGYIFEYDPYWWNEDLYFDTTDNAGERAGFKYTFKYPDPDDGISEEQIDYIQQWVQGLEDALDNSEDYSHYLDVDSWTRWLLAHDILGTWDGGGSNIFFTKYDSSDSSKVMMANMWDFDSALMQSGNWANQHTFAFFKKFLEQDSTGVFTRTFKRIYEEEANGVLDSLKCFIDSIENSPLYYAIETSMAKEYNVWGAVSRFKMSQEIERNRKWFNSRGKDLATLFSSLESKARFRLNITEAQWATVCVPFAFEAPQELDFYTVVGTEDNGAINLQLETSPQANLPYLVHGPTGKYTLYGTYKQTYDDLKSGVLIGTYEDIFVPIESYVLQNQNGVVGFYRVNSEDSIQLPANCAYLSISSSSMSRYRLPDDMDGILRVYNEDAAESLNLMGIPIGKTKSGIYLKRMVDGSYKKILVRDR